MTPNPKTILDNLQKIFPNLEVCFYDEKKYSSSDGWSKWRKYEEVKEDINFENDRVYRTYPAAEVIIDVEDKEHTEEIKNNLLSQNIKFKLYDTGGKGVHFHIFFKELENYSDVKRPDIKEYVMSVFAKDYFDPKKKDNRGLIGVEDMCHRNGQAKKTLIFETNPEFFTDNKLSEKMREFIDNMPEPEKIIIDGEIKPMIIFKDKIPCEAIQNLIKNGQKHPYRNYGAMLIVQQLRDYCYKNFDECFDILKKYNEKCIPTKKEENLRHDLVEQFKRKYNICCETLKNFGVCPYKNSKDCPKYKKFAVISTTATNKVDNFSRAISKFADKLDLAEKFIEIQPIFYERKNQFWVWNFESFCWELKDETDILNLISKHTNADTINSNEKNTILEALKQVGRLNRPQEIKPTWVQFKDKIYDIESGEFFEATPDYFVSNPIDWKVGTSEATPTIDKLIKSWVSGKDVDKLYEIFAYTIIPKMFIHSFFFLYGPPGMGKGTFVNTLIKFIGKRNSTATSINRINNNSRFETYNWYKKLLITMSEVSDINDLKNSGLINQATGEDPIPAEIKGGDSFDFTNYGKFIYPTNKLLKVDPEDGFGRRVRVIKFVNRFEKEKDVLDEIPDCEFENLAKKCLRIGKDLWFRRQFTDDVNISERMKKYQEISKSPMEIFISNYCDLSDSDAMIPFNDFYTGFVKFLMIEKKEIPNRIQVSKSLRNLGFETRNHSWPVVQNTIDGPLSNWVSKNTVFGIKIREDVNKKI